ncbi:lipocalin family protein [Streptomyces sp. NPDC001410]|uniref:lipocalin family protein n=1 Tax=Streptomyces sp. NPDC001410 TaxID=3364574 RepID=UPI0036AE5DC3
MSLDGIRAASRMVGRRTTLRYLAVGVGASLLAACKGNGNDKSETKAKGTGDGSGGAKGDSGGGSSSSPSPAPGVTGKAFAAFVRGTWKVTSTMPGGEKVSFSAVVDDGVWTLKGAGGKPEKGTWSLQGGRLTLGVPEDFSGGSSGQTAFAADVPAAVGERASLVLPWQPPGMSGSASGEQLEVNYIEHTGVLEIRHVEDNGSTTVHLCRRA